MPPQTSNLVIKDPRTLTVDLMPFIVLSNAGDTIGNLIDLRTDMPGDHPVSHAMMSIHPGKFVMQGLFFEEIPMDNYLKPNGWLAFVQLVGSNPSFVKLFNNTVESHLALPAWRRFYNFVEIFGQAIGQPQISFPGLFDCSMIDIAELKLSSSMLPGISQIDINAMSKFLNPEQLWDIINKNPDVFKIYGYWDSKIGITV